MTEVKLVIVQAYKSSLLLNRPVPLQIMGAVHAVEGRGCPARLWVQGGVDW